MSERDAPEPAPTRIGICWADFEYCWWSADKSEVCPQCSYDDDDYADNHSLYVLDQPEEAIAMGEAKRVKIAEPMLAELDRKWSRPVEIAIAGTDEDGDLELIFRVSDEEEHDPAPAEVSEGDKPEWQRGGEALRREAHAVAAQTPPYSLALRALSWEREARAQAEAEQLRGGVERDLAAYLQEALDETADMEEPHRFHMLRVKVLSRISALTSYDEGGSEQ